jgi:enoyl-[acyl-carrier protein] reductase I
MKLLEGKKGLICGVANSYSIGWAIAQAAHEAGATLGFTYLNEAIEKRLRPLAESLGSDLILPCDVASDSQIDDLFRSVESRWGSLDFLVHSIAFARREDLEGEYLATSREGFRIALEISAYSLVSLARGAAPLMKEGGSLLTLTYYGSEKVIRNYNVMGVAKAALEASVRYLAADLGPRRVRVNALSAGAIKTLSAKGIRGFNDMLTVYAEKSPLRRNVDPSEVGRSAVFLLSDWASGITGEVLYVDSGYHILGL